jgi:hypothetical protein
MWRGRLNPGIPPRAFPEPDDVLAFSDPARDGPEVMRLSNAFMRDEAVELPGRPGRWLVTAIDVVGGCDGTLVEVEIVAVPPH